MILEAFISTKLSNSIKNHNTSKENYTDSDDEELKNQAHKEIQESGGLIALWSVIAIILFIFWIISIVDASGCPSKGVEKALGIIIAIFWWPIYWIVKWAGGFCTGKKKYGKKK